MQSTFNASQGGRFGLGSVGTCPVSDSSDFRATVLATLGAAPTHVEPGKLHRFAVSNKPGDLAGWCKLYEDGQRGVFGDFRTGISEVWRARREPRLVSVGERMAHALQLEMARRVREAALARQWAEARERNRRLWDACLPVQANDPVGRYLANRLKCGLTFFPEVLRLHPCLPYWHEGRRWGAWPAMVAALTNPAGQTVALHRTWLTADGFKASVPVVKKLSKAAGPVMGSCVRLAQVNASGVIGIAEGLETAMAAQQASGVPTLAAYSASALAHWQWSHGTRHVVVFADADDAGRHAASVLRRRSQTAGLLVQVLTPAEPGADWCDVWAARGEREVQS